MSLEGTRYFMWLYSIVKKEEYVSYRKMIRVLHGIPFIWSVPNDDNRAGDGLALRERYCDIRNLEVSPDLFEEPASVLEVLIALAQRMDLQLYEPGLGSRWSIWFWEFIGNLKLNQYSDNQWGRGCEQEVRDIVDIFLNRKYDALGVGGIFPLRRGANKDQRLVELWYQMMAYFDENYPS